MTTREVRRLIQSYCSQDARFRVTQCHPGVFKVNFDYVSEFRAGALADALGCAGVTMFVEDNAFELEGIEVDILCIIREGAWRVTN